jgi:hypothetical protein
VPRSSKAGCRPVITHHRSVLRVLECQIRLVKFTNGVGWPDNRSYFLTAPTQVDISRGRWPAGWMSHTAALPAQFRRDVDGRPSG